MCGTKEGQDAPFTHVMVAGFVVESPAASTCSRANQEVQDLIGNQKNIGAGRVSSQMAGTAKGSCLLVLVLVFVASLFAVGQARAADYSLDSEPAADAKWLVAEPEFLPVDEAFRLSAVFQPNGAVLAQWRMADGYYLYRRQFDAKLDALGSGAQLGQLAIPEGLAKVDEYFGEVEVYYGSVDIGIPLTGSLPDGASLTIEFQGCADAGLYPPERKLFQVSGPSLLPVAAASRSPQSQALQAGVSQTESAANKTPITSNVGAGAGAGAGAQRRPRHGGVIGG